MKAFADIYKVSDRPWYEIHCTDFEDQADIYLNWESFEGTTLDGSSPGGAIDTWRWNDFMSHSPGHSMHNSFIEDSYYGNQVDDILWTSIDNSEDNYETIKIEFWHFCEGQASIENDIAGYPDNYFQILLDYGHFEYSLDGGAWTDVSVWQVDDYCDPEEYGHWQSQLYFESEDEDPSSPTFGQNIWQQITGEIAGTESVDTVEFRWRWNFDACDQFAGWYIDDVCIYGQEQIEYDEDYIDQMYSYNAFELCDGQMVYTFPRKFDFTEGDYEIRYWLLVEHRFSQSVNSHI